MILVMKNLNKSEIPAKFVLLRWTKAATITPIFRLDGSFVEQCSTLEDRQLMTSELISDFYCCLGLVEDKPDLLKKLSLLLKQEKESLSSSSSSVNYGGGSSSNLRNAGVLVGGSIATEINVLPPPPAKNKGSGKQIGRAHV